MNNTEILTKDDQLYATVSINKSGKYSEIWVESGGRIVFCDVSQGGLHQLFKDYERIRGDEDLKCGLNEKFLSFRILKNDVDGFLPLLKDEILKNAHVFENPLPTFESALKGSLGVGTDG